MVRFNHAFDFAFEVITDLPVDDVTPAMLRAALLERINRIDDAELCDACGCFDSFEMEEDADGLHS